MTEWVSMKCTIVHEENIAKSIEESVAIAAVGALVCVDWIDLVVGLYLWIGLM